MMLAAATSRQFLGGPGSHLFPSGTAKGHRPMGVQCAVGAMLATPEDLDVALGDQRPPYKPPDLPLCYAIGFNVPRSHKEAMRSEHAHLWKDSAGRDFYGLLDAGSFEPG